MLTLLLAASVLLSLIRYDDEEGEVTDLCKQYNVRVSEHAAAQQQQEQKHRQHTNNTFVLWSI